MAVKTYRIGTPREPGEGLRIGTVRFLPRGVAKKDYAHLDYFDVWLPILAPSRELLKQYRAQPETPRRDERFFKRYEREMLADTDSRQTLILLAELGRRTDIRIGCYCADESRCHRSSLKRLLDRAAAGEFG